MPKFKSLLLLTALFLSSCTREVYLQPVPCVDCEPCPQCTDLTPECCPEIAEQTQILVYQVYDVPAVPTCYQPCATCEAPKSNCRTVCRQYKVSEEPAPAVAPTETSEPAPAVAPTETSEPEPQTTIEF